MKHFLIYKYLFFAAEITIVCLLIYACVQQTYRSSANDPQIQMVNDMNIKIQKGENINKYFSDSVDLNKSLSTFYSFYDINGMPILSSGYLNGEMLRIPKNVFNGMKTGDQKELTTQPAKDVRLAMVILSTSNKPFAFIAAGRSFKEIEKRELNLVRMIFIVWLFMEFLLLLYLFKIPSLK